MFGDVVVVRDLNLKINDGELLVLVGSSGCGKTTSLRLLSGLELATYGRINIGDREVTLLPPGKRDVAMVFQGYALYPHMSVRKNLSFGPRMRREPRREIAKRVDDVAEMLGLDQLLDRKPRELSGGQRQRVALGRALLREPALFLLDEPLSNLDAALRAQMRSELIRLHRGVGTTTVFVTHDQVEALTMGDRIAVMSEGDLVQVGSPEDVYSNPVDTFVAQFIGSPKMTMTPGLLKGASNAGLTIDWFEQEVAVGGELEQELGRESQLIIGVRAEDVHWATEAPARCTIELAGQVDVVEPTGSETFVELHVSGTPMTARLPKIARLTVGSAINLRIDPGDLYVFAPENGKRVISRLDPSMPRLGDGMDAAGPTAAFAGQSHERPSGRTHADAP
jgi:multiple sugar transport system ATP-binding protein